MKIGLVCPYNMARGGAVQEIVRDSYRELTALGHDVRIITPEPQEDSDHYNKQGIIFLGNGTDFRSPFHTTPTFSVSVDTDEIEQMLDREKFDILHFHEPWVPILSRQILSRSKAVNIATFHAKLPETLMSRTVARVVTPYTKSVLKYLHALTAVSDAAADYVRSLTDEPVTIIPNGINLKHFKARKSTPPPDAHDLKTILYLGRLEQRKGPKYLLKAYAELVKTQHNVRLIMAGKGPDREKLETLAEELELPNVTFLGFVSDEEKLELLQSADLFCSPAIHGESFGLVLLEALACGVVTVAGDNPGYVAVMKEMGALSLVNPRETDEFARRLSVLLTEEVLRADWKKWARTYVKQFDYPAIIKRYEELYTYTLNHHNHRVKPFDDDEA